MSHKPFGTAAIQGCPLLVNLHHGLSGGLAEMCQLPCAHPVCVPLQLTMPSKIKPALFTS